MKTIKEIILEVAGVEYANDIIIKGSIDLVEKLLKSNKDIFSRWKNKSGVSSRGEYTMNFEISSSGKKHEVWLERSDIDSGALYAWSINPEGEWNETKVSTSELGTSKSKKKVLDMFEKDFKKSFLLD
jgi:hypothetical protein